MIRLPQRETKSLLAIHGWSAVCLGLLLYVVIVTGVACVFADEIGDWASPLPEAPTARFPSGIDAPLRTFAESVDPSQRDAFFAFPRAGGRMYAQFHHDARDASGKMVEHDIAVDIDPATMQIENRREGDDDALAAADRTNAISNFFINLHVRLHVPEPWGLLLTGVLGLAMMVAAVSGFLIHRHLIRELFTLRRRRDLLSARDAHVVAGTWNLLFSFLLAFTGSFFSFASSFGVPVMAMVAFNGDQEKALETMVGNPPASDPRPATLANLDAMLADARTRTHSEIYYIGIEHWGRADARVSVTMLPPEGELLGTTYVYDGPSGGFQYEKPALGRVPSVGGALYGLMAPLHFGNFAGVLSKGVWFALGFAAAYVALSGMRLWTTRRAAEPGWRPLTRAVAGIGHGLPLALTAAAAACFIAQIADAELEPVMMRSFLAVLALALAACWMVRDAERVSRALLLLNGVLMLALPALRLLAGGPGWGAMFATGQFAVPAIDSALIIAGLTCLLAVWRATAAERGARQALRFEQVRG
ncbi:PepSY-associated TM helix domain-containing protein [Solimonas marina]|uniref:PepSY domain-containing protein n=1 Tax=Solimonas marina TaxID=2714601 RepID=A0A969W804_9GAMM|nr:PepSY-associated TM helix domain-containing protein [Solimonas marina]NKF21235.1 PepSY domain-containing protein [Solimonas marina]